jgi:hypothetical protein
MAFFAATACSSFIALNMLTGNSLLVQLQQAWGAHFASAKSFEYGSPEQHPFEFNILWKNWELTLPALIGLVFLMQKLRKTSISALPLAWLGLTLVVFALHKPWWPYYYIHNALPLCWCAGVGIWKTVQAALPRVSTITPQSGNSKPPISTQKPRLAFQIGVALYGLLAISWMVTRIYLEEQAIRNSPKISATLVLKEIKSFKPFTNFMFADQPIYSFHSGIPMPPHLAMISLKRFWTGDMSNARLIAEMEAAKPELILLGNDRREVPFDDLLNREYRMVYRDGAHRLYAHHSISKKRPL